MKARATLFTIVAIAALVIPIASAGAGGSGGSCMGNAAHTDARSDTVEMKDNCFGPTVARINTGETVTFVNVDAAAHTVGGVNGTFGDPYAEIVPGDEVSFTFDRDGVYPYACLFHPGMAGAVVVGDGAGKVSSATGITSRSAKDQSQPNSAAPVSESSGGGTPVVPLAVAAALVVTSVGALARFRARPLSAPVRGAATPRR